jgi:hypothetical protein
MREGSVPREMQRRRHVKRQRKWEEEEELTHSAFRTYTGLTRAAKQKHMLVTLPQGLVIQSSSGVCVCVCVCVCV